jgi:hypothetical protein
MDHSPGNRLEADGCRGIILAAVLLIGPALAGCDGGGSAVVTTTTDSTTTTTAPTTTTTVATTTTTLSGQGVLDVFLGYITSPDFAGRADLAIDAAAGEVAFSASGTIEFVGENSHMIMEIPGLLSQEMISNHGVDYQRSAGGPWVTEDTSDDPFAEPVEGQPVPLEDLEFLAALKTMGDLEHQGVVEQDGVTLHRIGLPEGTEADPLAFGFGPDDQVGLKLVFWATPTGLPYEMVMTIDDLSEGDFPLSMEFSIRFVETGIPIEISSPDNAWLKYISDDLGYTIAYPRGWEIETDRDEWLADYFFGLQGEELNVFVTEIDPPEQVSLNAWLDSFRSSAVSEGDFTFGDAAEIDVVGLPGRTVTYTGGDEFGPFSAVYVVVQTDLDVVYELIVFGDVTDEQATRDLADDFLSTFQPAS